MPRHSSDHVSMYRLHKRSGQAVVVIAGKIYLLGEHGSPPSRERYNQVVAKCFAAGRESAAFRGRQAVLFDDWRLGDQRCFVANIDRAKQKLGSSRKAPLADGVARFGEWVKQNQATLASVLGGRVENKQ